MPDDRIFWSTYTLLQSPTHLPNIEIINFYLMQRKEKVAYNPTLEWNRQEMTAHLKLFNSFTSFITSQNYKHY